MHPFTIEHSVWAYRADFALYALASLSLAVLLLLAGPADQWPLLLGLALAGLAVWSLLEYLLHRFVLHGLYPFSRWHAQHHQRPHALICAPTLLSAGLIAALVFLPALLLGDWWQACALTFGLLTGYLGYALTHHVLHHTEASLSGKRWLGRRRRWHALHHQRAGTPDRPLGEPRGHYGVTTSFWDRVFGSHGRQY